MPSQTVVLNAAGLVTSPNELSRKEGALIEASNVLIRRDGIIEQRRGYNLYGSPLPEVNERVKQLTTYRSRILRHYSNTLAFDSNAQGAFLDFAGSISETQVGLRMKFIESNGNLYFTTSDGIKKISARNADDFSISDGFITPAGAIKAVDIDGEIIYTPNSQSAFLPQDGAVAYRVVWAYKDINGNLIQGSPSQRAVVGNPMIDLLLRDYMRLLDALDSLQNTPLTTARIDDKNYVQSLGLQLSSSADDLRINLIALATKLDTDIFIADQGAVAPIQVVSATMADGTVTVTLSGADATTYLSPSSNIYLDGFNLSPQQEIQTVQFSATPTSGTFVLNYGLNNTAAINFNDAAVDVQTKMRAVDGLQNVVVSGAIDLASGLTLTFPTTDGDRDQVQLGANTLSSGTPVVVTTATTQEGISDVTGSINGAQVITTINATSFTFNTDAVGALSLASAQIHSNEFRVIPQPVTVDIPATNDELVSQQNYISNILLKMSLTPDTIISAADKVNTDQLDVTTTSTVRLHITIPDGVDSNYFFQIYRSSVAQATGANSFDDVVPSDELQQVYEAFPIPAELAAREITVVDITPDAFRGANLYTNASTAEGILQANEPPPFAKDINRYRNSVFYANTRTNQSMALNLLGVQQMINDYDNGIIPKVTISNGTTTNTYSFITGEQEITEITTITDIANSLNSTYFLINSIENAYYVYFETTTATDPAIPGRTGIKVEIPTGATADQVAQKLRDSLSIYLTDFIANVTTNVVEVINVDVGESPDTVDGDTGFGFINTQQGRGERVQPQITQIQAIQASDFVAIGPSDYFTINTTLDRTRYYVWFSNGASTDPAISGRNSIKVTLAGGETASQVSQLIATALPSSEYQSSVNGSIITVINIQYGTTTNAAEFVANAGFTITTTQLGALDVLLSPLASPARAVDETARSFIRVINKNPGESIYGYYLSGAFDVPGKMQLQARNLQNRTPFYVLANNANTGISFNPDISPEGSIVSIGTGNPALITTSAAHGMLTGDQVVLSSTNSVPIVDGLWTVTIVSPTSFTVPIIVDITGTSGSYIRAINSLFSENEEKSNRVYFSKYQQPEAVPIVNYFDVGAQDKAILRIFPMRDSLFVFKEDGLYRISGDSTPFQLELFNSSFITLAPDSVTIANNVIYAWTTQGIQSLTEGGAAVISRQIDNIILRLQSSNFPNFKTATWALGYESDNSYVVFTIQEEIDTVAQIAYRYSTLTNSWTTFDLSKGCGVINSADDKMYLGSTDVPYIEKEKKTFSRLDYSDREFGTLIANNALLGKNIILPTVTDYAVGDVLVQDQTITVFQFNTMLNKLDLDSGVTDGDYNTLALVAGSNPRTTLVNLANKLDADTGVNYNQFFANIQNKNGVITNISETANTIITSTNHGLLNGRIVLIDSSNSSPSINGTYVATVIDANRFSIPVKVIMKGTAGNWQTVQGNFEDMKICYNFIMATLNSDTGVSFNNYSLINNNTLQEAIIDKINRVTKTVTVNLQLDYLVGDVTIYKAIESAFTYSPNSMGDPLNHKHIREATLMFETRTLTRGIMSFKTDLLPEFQNVPFNLDGNGIFGHVENFGDGFFGGLSNSAPFRTYVPRQCQRCRYMIVKFVHSVARESYRINGTTLTGEAGLSSRAFR